MNKILLFSSLFFLGINTSTFAQCHPDFDALIDLYNATDGANWVYNDGWIEGAAGTNCDVCDWDYVQCNSAGRVTGLVMFSNGGPGVLPASIGDIEFLEYLNLSYWDLTGTIPSTIGQLTNLISLKLNDNDFTGSIPASIGNLVNLEQLDFGLCHDLSGSLPVGLANLTQLKKLFIHDTNITGSIPSGMGNMPNIERIEFTNNQFTGSIPSDLGNLTNISELDLGNNNLTGNIPASLSQLSNAFYIGLDRNDLSGCIPNELYAHCNNNVQVNLSMNPQLANGGDFNAFCTDLTGACNTTSTNEIAINSLQIYPNPASDVLMINAQDISFDEISICTIYGQEVLNYKVDSLASPFSIDVNQIPTGIYLISGLDDGLKVAQSKLLITSH